MKAILILALAALSSGLLCGGNCPSNTCPSCICGTWQSTPNASYWCSKHTWSMRCCMCIVQRESAGNKNAMNFNTDSSFDGGLWQINGVNWAGCGITADNVCNLQKNFECAVKIHGYGGNTWKYWATAPACGCSSSN